MHRTLLQSIRCGESARQHSPDAGTVSLQCLMRCVRCSARHTLGHRMLRPASDGHRPVVCRFENLSAHESGGHRTRLVPHKERPVTPRQVHITPRSASVSAVLLSPSDFAQPAAHPRALAACKSPPPVKRFFPVDFSSPRLELFPRRPPFLSSRQDPSSLEVSRFWGETELPCP